MIQKWMEWLQKKGALASLDSTLEDPDVNLDFQVKINLDLKLTHHRDQGAFIQRVVKYQICGSSCQEIIYNGNTKTYVRTPPFRLFGNT